RPLPRGGRRRGRGKGGGGGGVARPARGGDEGGGAGGDPAGARARRSRPQRRDGGRARARAGNAARRRLEPHPRAVQVVVITLLLSSPRKRGPIFQSRWLWVPACAGTTGRGGSAGLSMIKVAGRRSSSTAEQSLRKR